MSRLEAAAATARDVDSLRIDFRPADQVVNSAYAIPDFPARQVRAREVRKISQHGVLRADQVVAALAGLCIPELAALSLADRIPGEHDVATLHQALTQGLIASLAIRRMARRDQHRRMFPAIVIREIDQGSHIDPRKTLEHELLDVKAVHLNAAGDARTQRRSLRRQTAQHLQEMLVQLVLHAQ